MLDDASAKVSDANAGEKSRMADREGHGASTRATIAQAGRLRIRVQKINTVTATAS